MKRDIKIIDGKYFILSENCSTCSRKCKRWNNIEESEFNRLKELGHKDVTKKPIDDNRTKSEIGIGITDEEWDQIDNDKSILIQMRERYIKNDSPNLIYQLFLDAFGDSVFAELIKVDEQLKERLKAYTNQQGSRFNEGKLRWSLVDLKYLEGLVQVLMHGAAKYSEYNWQKGLPTLEVYESLMRHIVAWKSGENKDLESGLDHIDHAICNLYFMKWMIANKPSFDTRRTIIPEQEFAESKYPSENEK